MSRYIDADKLCEGLVSNDPVVIAAKCEPTADVEPVRHGHWIFRWRKISGDMFQCSNCAEVGYVKWYYCPYCGAKMDGKI